MMASDFTPCAGSFRDPYGRVYTNGSQIHRVITQEYATQWHIVQQSGFLEAAVDKGLLLPFKKISKHAFPGKIWMVLESPLLNFISYPYEWCFGQLKAAALHTLDIQDLALAHEICLRDATAYNVQFQGSQPIFIDHLSFAAFDKTKPWQAYLQFCKHFIAPLALMAKRSMFCNKLLISWVDGIPLDLASNLLPWVTRFIPSLGMHIHLHAHMQKKYSDARVAAKKLKKIKLSENQIPNLVSSLRQTIIDIKLPRHISTEWGDYYQDTNYSEDAANDKMNYLRTIVSNLSGKRTLAVDLGANTAVYSGFLAEIFSYVIALDIDYLAVERSYDDICKKSCKNLLPLVIDLCNPSPGIGWNNEERLSFKQRCQADYLSALAIIHHLFFTGGIPFDKIAAAFADITASGGVHVLEFVPIEDSQVQRLLAARTDVYNDYSLKACLDAFNRYFKLVEKHEIVNSKRTLLTWEKR